MRIIPIKLQQLHILKRRSILSESESKEYRFKVNTSEEVQIDNLLISGDRICTFEVKNYNFDLIYGSKSWHFVSGEEFKDLSMQVNRQRIALQQLLKKGSFHSAGNSVLSHLAFVNPEQTIYNMPNYENLIVPSNVKQRLSRLCKSNNYDQSSLFDFLESQRLGKSFYDVPVDLNFDQLRPGIYCYQCESTFELDKIHRNLYKCKNCKTDYKILQILENLLLEIKALNDSWKVTPTMLLKLSGGRISKATLHKYIKEGKLRL